MDFAGGIVSVGKDLWALVGPTAILLMADAVFGSFKAWRSDQFTFEWLYVFARTKGSAFFIGTMLLAFGQLSPDWFKVPGTDIGIDFFTMSGTSAIAALAVSLVASIGNNIKPDSPDAPPQGIVEMPRRGRVNK